MKTKKPSTRLVTNKGKKSADDATKKAKSAAKAAGDKALIEIATAMPHGSGKEFLVVTKELDDIEDQMSLLNKRKRGARARLKEMKIELRPYDHVRKLRKMEPEDVQGFEASVALYKDQLAMTLSVHQEIIKKEIVSRREAARDAMIDASGGDTGKEIGGGVINAIEDHVYDQQMPQKNEEFSPSAA